MVRSALPSLTLQTDNLSEPGTGSRVRIWATTMPSYWPASFCTPSTSSPSIVSRSANSSGDQSKSTYCLSQLRVTFIASIQESFGVPAPGPHRRAPRENFVNRRAALRKRSMIILAQQRRDGRGDLALRVRFRLGALAGGWRVRADHCDPVPFRIGDLFAVTLPIHRPAATTVIGLGAEGAP